MAKKDQDLSLTIGFEADKESLKEALDDVKKEIRKEQKKGKATVKVSASAADNTSPSRVLPGMSRIKNQKKHDALSFILGEAGGTWERFSTAADYHAGIFSPVQTRNRGYIKEIEVPDPTDSKGKKKIKQKELTAGGLVKHTNAVTDAVNAQIKRENSYARKYNLDTIKQSEREDILAAAMLHDRFKYTETGRINPNAMNDAAAWARVGGLDGAFNILSDPNSRGARIISAIDYATSQESRSGDMDENGRWNKDMKKSKLDVLDAAVKSGEGRWKDPDSAHVVDNFEVINDATQDENENLEDWRDNLKGVIGDLGIIALILKGIQAIAKGVIKFDAFSEKMVKGVAEGMPTRSNIGATTEDIHRMRAASGYLNLPQETIYNSVAALAERQGEFATTGKGLELFYGSVARGLEPILKNMNDPQQAWNSAMDLFLNELTVQKQAGNQQEVDKLLNSIRQFMGDEAATVLSRMLDFNFDTQSTNDVTSIAALLDKYRNNPYGDESERAEALNSELNTLRQSIQQSYNAIASDWMEYFGKPFREFWDSFLIKFIDWYRKFTGIDRRELNSAAWIAAASEAFSGEAFSYQDLKKTAKGANYSSVRNVGIAEDVWSNLPDYLKQVLNESASNGKFDYKNANNWNLLMAAEAIKNQDEHGNPYFQDAKANRLRGAMKNAGIYKGGYLGWLAAKYAADAGVSTDIASWGDEEQKTFSKYLHDKGIDVAKAYGEYIQRVINDIDPIKTNKFDKNAAGTRFATRWSKQYKDAAFGTDESIRKMFTKNSLDWMDNDPGISDKVTNYINSRLQASGAGTLLADENVTNYERLFATRIANVLDDTTTTDEAKIEYINAFIDELIRQYAATGEYNKTLQSGEDSKDTTKAGDKTAMTNPTINITVNGVDTNNANEVAYAVSSELKPALAAQTDSVV